MRLSKSGLGALNARYCAVLKKCFLINTGLFFIASGAIAADRLVVNSGDEVEVPSGSEFIGITGEAVGGAIYNEGKINFAGPVIFKGNSVTTAAGAIYNEGTIGTLKADFIDNKAISDKGQSFAGAIYNTGVIEKITGNFIGNEALLTVAGNYADGGAILSTGANASIKIVDSNFANNRGLAYGGAIYNEKAKLDISNTSFTGNYGVMGGALYNYSGAVTLDGVDFKNNTTARRGGAIYTSEKSGANTNFIVKNSAFTENKAVYNGGKDKEVLGGAISLSYGTLTIENSEFNGNEAPAAAGAVNVTGPEAIINITNSDFIGNKITPVDAALGIPVTGGGAIYAQYSTTTINGGKFLGNTSTLDGGAIYYSREDPGVAEAKLNLNDITFEDNIAASNGGAIYNQGADIALKNIVFVNNKAGDKLNDIYNDTNGNINVSGSLELDGGIAGDGKLTFAQGSDLTVKADTTKISNEVINEGASINFKIVNGFEGEYEMVTGSLDTEFDIVENNLYNITSVKNGTYDIIKKTNDELSESVGATGNEANIIGGITSGPSDNNTFNDISESVSTLLQSSDKADVNKALEALNVLAPDISPIVRQTQTQALSQITSTVESRLSGIFALSSASGISSGDSDRLKGVSAWVQGIYSQAEVDDKANAKGFDTDMSGAAMGLEKKISNDVKAGVGYAYSQSEVDGFMRTADVYTHTVLVYGEYKPADWFVNVIASYGWSGYDETKNVLGTNVYADYDVKTFSLQTLFGYDMSYNGFAVTPEAGLRYLHISQDGYADTAGQHISANDSDIVTGVIGTKVGYDLTLENGAVLTPQVRFAATYDIQSDDVNSDVTLANGVAYTVRGEGLERFGMEFDVGTVLSLDDSKEISIGYEVRYRSDYQDHSGLINFKYNF